MKPLLTLHLIVSYLVAPVGTVYCVAVEHKVRLGVKAFVSQGTPSHYFVLLLKGDKGKMRASGTNVCT